MTLFLGGFLVGWVLCAAFAYSCGKRTEREQAEAYDASVETLATLMKSDASARARPDRWSPGADTIRSKTLNVIVRPPKGVH